MTTLRLVNDDGEPRRWGEGSIDEGQVAYSELSFYTRSTNKNNHDKRLGGVNMPPELVSAVNNLIHHEQYKAEYASPQDFIRDAIVHHVARRNAQLADPDMKLVVEQGLRRFEMKEWTEELEASLEESAGYAERLRESLQLMAKHGAWGKIATALRKTEEVIDTMSDPWYSQVRTVIDEWWPKVPGPHA